MPHRFALYYAPSASDPLWDRASVWLGRDPATGTSYEGAVAGMERTQLLNLTQSANRYGFHATIKPPMTLAAGTTLDDLQAAMSEFAKTIEPVELGQLELASLDGFLALVPNRERDAALHDFAANVVESFEPYRAPLSPREFAARVAKELTPRQEELLEAYGYPYVFDEFRFHMTLTDRLGEADHAEVLSAAQTWFGPVLETPMTLDRLVIFSEPESGMPFTRLADYRLGQ